MYIGFEAASHRLLFEAERMPRPCRDPIIHIGAELENTAALAGSHFHLTGNKRHILDGNAHIHNRRNQKVLLAFPFEHCRKQLDQSRPTNRRLLIEPCAVGSDPHIDVAAEGWIPSLY